MPSNYTVQAVGRHGEPGEDCQFSDAVVGEALKWINDKFSAGSSRVNVWHVGGKIIATLKSPPPPVQSLRDLLLFDAVARTSEGDGSATKTTITPMRRKTPTLVAPVNTTKTVKRASSGDMPELSQLLTEAVAEEKGN